MFTQRLIAAVVLCAATTPTLHAAEPPAAPPLPARQESWIGPPQSWEHLEGKVVLLDVWTFG